MYGTKLQKTISIIIAVILLSVSPLGVFALASDVQPCGCGYAPSIFLTGINSINIMKNPGTVNEEVIFPPSSDGILSVFGLETYMNLAKFAVTQDWDCVADALIPVADKVLEDFACNPDGTVKNGTGINWIWPSYAVHTPDYAPGFYYDWRVDPMEVACQLKDYINYVCESTGHDKVNLIAFSMGSTIAMAYIQQFGYDKIAGIVLSSAALNGVSCAGEPFAGNVKFDANALVRYIDSFMSNEGKGALITSFVKVLQKAGIVGTAVDIVNEVVEKLKDRVYTEILTKSFGSCPGMWSLVPDEYYNDAKALLLSDTVTYAGLIEKIDNYHYNVQAKNEELVDGLIERGINFGIVLKYNLQGFPCGNSVNNSADTVIDAKYSSFGATIADLDHTLGKDYVQAVSCGHNHISPDNKIDASSCRYPEQTWFVRDFVHMRGSYDYDELVRYILFSEKHATVFDNEKYPQFLILDEKTEKISPLTAESGNDDLSRFFDENSWIFILLKFFNATFTYLQQSFSAV